MIRHRIADVFETSLEITEVGGGHADLEGGDATLARETPWMIVGRFDPLEEIGYQMLGAGLKAVERDLLIEAAIHPQRLSQIRVEFDDPNSKRSEDLKVLSKIGPWEFVISDLVGELVGADPEAPTVASLAERYDETLVPRFYIFFAPTIIKHRPAAPWMTVPVRKG